MPGLPLAHGPNAARGVTRRRPASHASVGGSKRTLGTGHAGGTVARRALAGNATSAELRVGMTYMAQRTPSVEPLRNGSHATARVIRSPPCADTGQGYLPSATASALARYKVLGAGVSSLILTLGVARFAYTPLLPRWRSRTACQSASSTIRRCGTLDLIHSLSGLTRDMRVPVSGFLMKRCRFHARTPA